MKLQKLGLLAVGISILAAAAGANAAPIYMPEKVRGHIPSLLKIYQYGSVNQTLVKEDISKSQALELVARHNLGKNYCIRTDRPLDDYVSTVRNDEVKCARAFEDGPKYFVGTVLWRANRVANARPKTNTVRGKLGWGD